MDFATSTKLLGSLTTQMTLGLHLKGCSAPAEKVEGDVSRTRTMYELTIVQHNDVMSDVTV